MHSTLNPKQTDPQQADPQQTDPQDVLVIAPDIVLVAPGASSQAPDAMGHPSDPQTHTGFGSSAGGSVPPADTTLRAAAGNNIKARGNRASVGGQAIRGFIGILLAALIGVGAMAWNDYGDAAKRIIGRWAQQPVLTSSPQLENPVITERSSSPTVQASAANPVFLQSAALAQTAPEAAPTTVTLSPESAQLLQSMARDLTSVGQEIEQLKASIAQLKAGQEQMSRDVAKASEQNLRPRAPAPPLRPAAAPARKPWPPLSPSEAAAAPRSP